MGEKYKNYNCVCEEKHGKWNTYMKTSQSKEKAKKSY